MMDHASELLDAVRDVLLTGVPVPGGWLLTRMKQPQYPFGTIDITSTIPERGQGFYAEVHRGVISVWGRSELGMSPDPRVVFELASNAHRVLQASSLSSGTFTVSQFTTGDLTPRNPDGLTWGRSFTFTAMTYEVENG